MGEKNSRKSKQRNKYRKIIIALKNFKKRKEEEEKGNLHRTAKPNTEAEVYNNNKKCDPGKKKKTQK